MSKGKCANNYLQDIHIILKIDTSGAGTAHPSGAPEFTPGF
jgi:hypothetical protein